MKSRRKINQIRKQEIKEAEPVAPALPTSCLDCGRHCSHFTTLKDFDQAHLRRHAACPLENDMGDPFQSHQFDLQVLAEVVVRHNAPAMAPKAQIHMPPEEWKKLESCFGKVVLGIRRVEV